MHLAITGESPRIAYFSMEIALASPIPTYSGGLGVLAGDTLRSAADLGLGIVGVTLIYRKGYFRQHLDGFGNQSESQDLWNPEEVLQPVDARAAVTIDGREVQVRAWRYDLPGISGHTAPVYFLDTAVPENSDWDQTLTDHLYGGDSYYRLCQEVVLGMGGMAILSALGFKDRLVYHMNEGHSALLALSLLESRLKEPESQGALEAAVESVRHRCVFTTHTPVPAGQDQFPWELVRQVLGQDLSALLEATHCCMNGNLNMTYLALRFARYINGVAMRHGEISTGMFPDYPIDAITNGVHAVMWASPSFADLFDRHIPEWRLDNFYLRYAVGISLHEISEAHALAKQALLAEVARQTGVSLPGH
ncbi:MAG: alpha-glucan family phosphorylase, partial [Desulfobaccales bacterium]